MSHPHGHQLSAEQAAAELESGSSGLSDAEARARLQEYGPNRLPAAPGRHPLLRFALHFHNILIYVLLAAAAITAALGHWVDTAVILASTGPSALSRRARRKRPWGPSARCWYPARPLS
ncbi:cation-transporting P-type ATPase [Microbulbifer sp.]|uniref:cation-transporting P-type ATPase n=1 Tax=Microbulbifer sp. TaxID=1908541 RepID=UPI003F2AE405